MIYRYPINLFKVIQSNWKRKRWAEERIPPLPKKETVQTLIDTVYHASFLVDETRRLWFRVIYLDPDKIEGRKKLSKHTPLLPELNMVKFDSVREFTVGELVKLAPAADPTQALMGVFENKKSKKLEIYGLIDAGASWWNFIRHESGHGKPPPEGLTVSSKEPGQFTISRQGIVILTLKQGKLYEPSDIVFHRGPVSNFLDKGASLLHKAVCENLSCKCWDDDGEDEDYPKRVYISFIERILNKIREMRHGGTIIVIPDCISKEDTRLTDRITIKYPGEYNCAWDRLVEELSRHKRYYQLHFELLEKNNISKEEYRKVEGLAYEEDYTTENISDSVGFISALSGVDGAVVITDKLRLVGFGAEIIATSLTLKKVRVITDVRKNKGEYREIDLFGTRHRSALRFCSSFEDCLAFIVSQDGDIRVAKRVGSEVILWPDINIGNISF